MWIMWITVRDVVRFFLQYPIVIPGFGKILQDLYYTSTRAKVGKSGSFLSLFRTVISSAARGLRNKWWGCYIMSYQLFHRHKGRKKDNYSNQDIWVQFLSSFKILLCSTMLITFSYICHCMFSAQSYLQISMITILFLSSSLDCFHKLNESGHARTTHKSNLEQLLVFKAPRVGWRSLGPSL